MIHILMIFLMNLSSYFFKFRQPILTPFSEVSVNEAHNYINVYSYIYVLKSYPETTVQSNEPDKTVFIVPPAD